MPCMGVARRRDHGRAEHGTPPRVSRPPDHPDLCPRAGGFPLIRLRTGIRRNRYVFNLITETAGILEMTSFATHPSRNRGARTGGGLRDDPRELPVARASGSRRSPRYRRAPLLFTILGNFFVYCLDNLGARRTIPISVIKL
jgi:hypothetical protein